jgi:DNA-3-methyladenine glycosylase I
MNQHVSSTDKYRQIFKLAEKTLLRQVDNRDAFDSKIIQMKSFENRKWSDEEVFEKLVMVPFYSGIKASMVETKQETILKCLGNSKLVARYSDNDIARIMKIPGMIKNLNKIKSTIKNAIEFEKIISEFGSFTNYLSSFETEEDLVNILVLKEELEEKFSHLGKITVYHFMTDLGLPVLKPDRVIMRIFKRLGLIENDQQYLKAVICGSKMAKAANEPIRYIDIVLVKLGQVGQSREVGIKGGVCLERNPLCIQCDLSKICKYQKVA